MSQVVVVTGGAGGIGSAICRALDEDGHNVVVADFNEPAAQELAGDIGKNGGQALAVGVDVGDKASVDGMIAAAIEKFGHIDVQLNAAGVIKRCPVLEMPADEWERVIRVNLTGIFLCSQAAAIHMAERKAGRIINVASGRGVTGQAPGLPLCRVQGRSHHLLRRPSPSSWHPTTSPPTPSDPAPPRPTWPGQACRKNNGAGSRPRLHSWEGSPKRTRSPA